jgi:tetratricopeptide (TPR) repeat protein
MKRTFPKFLAVAFLAAPLLATPVHAAGDGSSSDTPKCSGGKVWDKAKKKCVDPQRGMIDDDSIYETGRDLAMAGRYGEAITVLSLAADKSDPRILNYLGYSHRKADRVLVGLGYYREALIQDPDYTLVREYMGEAYLQNGDVQAAVEQLGEIEKRCGKGCREYTLLAEQIDAYRKS